MKNLQKAISTLLDSTYPNSIENDKWILVIDPDFPEDAIIKFRKKDGWVSYKRSAVQPIMEFFHPMRYTDAGERLCDWFDDRFNVKIDTIDNAIVTTFKLKNFI